MLVNLLRKKEEKSPQDSDEDILDEDLDNDLEELEDITKEGTEKEELDEEDEEEEEEEKRPFKAALWEIIKDVIIAFIIVIIIIGGIYIYTGNWPPVVVVESDSMQHSDDESKLGVIDTGDLVLVKSIDGKNDVVPYMKGKRIDHETYGEYGDVLIYQKNGYSDTTPVIHRAIVYLKYNVTSNSFDIPELKYKHHKVPDDWYVEGGETRWYALTGSVVLKDIGYDHIDVKINLRAILDNFANNNIEPHSGFITLGDHNDARYDQANLNDEHGGIVRPVRPEWVVGKARGELPWFGAIKLYLTDDNPDDGQGREAVPENSWTWLIISIVLIFAVPICIDITLILLDRRRGRLEEEGDEEEEEEQEGLGEEEGEGGEDEDEEEEKEDEELDIDGDDLPHPGD